MTSLKIISHENGHLISRRCSAKVLAQRMGVEQFKQFALLIARGAIAHYYARHKSIAAISASGFSRFNLS